MATESLPEGITFELQTAAVEACGQVMDAWLRGSRPSADAQNLTTEQCTINVLTAILATSRRFMTVPEPLRRQAILSTGVIMAGWLHGRKTPDSVTTEQCTINVLTALLTHSV